MDEGYKYGRCVTHHYACDCREKQFEDAMRVHREMIGVLEMDNRKIRKKYGNMTAEEIKVAKSVITFILIDSTWKSTNPKRIDA